MIRVASLPVGQDDHARALLADDAGDLQAVLPGVFHAAVGNVERLPPGDAQDARGFGGFVGALFGSAARPHLALGEVENAGAVLELRHLE